MFDTKIQLNALICEFNTIALQYKQKQMSLSLLHMLLLILDHDCF